LKTFATVCVCTALLLSPGSAGAQSGGADAQVPAVFSALQGAWSGSGTLMGRTASFAMTWEAQTGGFVELHFRNAFVDASGAVTPVLEARALYRPSGTTAIGVWIDTRPQRIQLESEITQSAVITNWTAATERGRTEYRIEEGGVTVRDYVEGDGEMRLFGEARYTRVSGGM
jgi:hypothetical protein